MPQLVCETFTFSASARGTVNPVDADRAANGWCKLAGFPHAGTLTRAIAQITFGDDSRRKVEGPQRTCTGGLTSSPLASIFAAFGSTLFQRVRGQARSNAAIT